MIVPPNMKKAMIRIQTHGPPRSGPKLSADSHEPMRLNTLGPVSQRLVSRSAPQMAQPAANGLTGSRQLGHRLRSGIADRMASRSACENPLSEQGDEAGHDERARPQPLGVQPRLAHDGHAQLLV